MHIGGGQNEYGAGIVTSLRVFDREEHKEYYMPIIMKDSGSPSVTGTNTLTIIIGDVNDNKHYPGHKNIFVYNYKGEDLFPTRRLQYDSDLVLQLYY